MQKATEIVRNLQ